MFLSQSLNDSPLNPNPQQIATDTFLSQEIQYFPNHGSTYGMTSAVLATCTLRGHASTFSKMRPVRGIPIVDPAFYRWCNLVTAWGGRMETSYLVGFGREVGLENTRKVAREHGEGNDSNVMQGISDIGGKEVTPGRSLSFIMMKTG